MQPRRARSHCTSTPGGDVAPFRLLADNNSDGTDSEVPALSDEPFRAKHERQGVEMARHPKLTVRSSPFVLLRASGGGALRRTILRVASASLRRAKDGQGGIRTPEGVSQQIYSLPPLAAWVPARVEAEGLRAPALTPESWDLQLELAVGLAPTTACLQNRCSTVELRQLVPSLSRYYPILPRRGRSDARVVLPAAADSRDGNGDGQALTAPPSPAAAEPEGRGHAEACDRTAKADRPSRRAPA
jgi:hypothetical protein